MLTSLLFAWPAVCRVPMHDICFRGAKCGKKDFSVKCCLLAFNIVVLGPVVSLELFVSRAFVASYHANHIYPRPVFSSDRGEAVALLRESYTFL